MKQLLKLMESYKYISNYGFGGNIKMSFIHSFTKYCISSLCYPVILHYARQMRNTGGHDFQRSCFCFFFSISLQETNQKLPIS